MTRIQLRRILRDRDLSLGARSVYLWFCTTDRRRVPLATVAVSLGISLRSTKSYMKELCTAGWVLAKRHKRASEYELRREPEPGSTKPNEVIDREFREWTRAQVEATYAVWRKMRAEKQRAA